MNLGRNWTNINGSDRDTWKLVHAMREAKGKTSHSKYKLMAKRNLKAGQKNWRMALSTEENAATLATLSSHHTMCCGAKMIGAYDGDIGLTYVSLQTKFTLQMFAYLDGRHSAP